MTDEQRTTTANSGLAKGGASCFVETFVKVSTFMFRMYFSAKNPALRQAANRYVQPYPTDRATINRQKNERQNANASQNKKSYNATHKPTQL